MNKKLLALLLKQTKLWFFLKKQLPLALFTLSILLQTACSPFEMLQEKKELDNLREEAYEKNVELTQIQLSKVDSLLMVMSKVLEQNPNSGVKDYYTVMTAISNDLKGIESELSQMNLNDKSTTLTDQLIIIEKEHERFNNIIEMVHQQLNEGVDQTEANATLFARGQYELTEDGKNLIAKYVEKIDSAVVRMQTIADKPLELAFNFTTVGYSDDAAHVNLFVYQLLDEKELTTQDLPYPQKSYQYKPNRLFLNKILSELRARSVYKAMKEYMLEKGYDARQIKGEPVGYGEELPPNVDPENVTDDERRVCQFSITIIPMVDSQE